MGVNLLISSQKYYNEFKNDPGFVSNLGDFTTNLAASIALWFLYSFSPSVVLTSAPTERQVKQLLWREIRARHRMAKVKLAGRPLTMQLELGPLWYALGFSTNDANACCAEIISNSFAFIFLPLLLI